MTADPTVLFRIFRYPPAVDDGWGVGEHTDYGLLTILATDANGGLQVHAPGGWIDVPSDPGVFVVNLGDMLDRMTEGRYRSTPHRVRNTSGAERLSFPCFIDPSWDAVCPVLPLDGTPPADDAARRWDGSSVRAWDGTYGEYLTAKVAKVFPELFRVDVSYAVSSRALITVVTGRSKRCSTRWGRSLFSHREIPGGSVDRMISSWGCSMQHVVDGAHRVGVADDAVDVGPLGEEPLDCGGHPAAGDGLGVALRPGGVLVRRRGRHEQREAARAGVHPGLDDVQAARPTRRLVGDDEDPAWFHGDHLLITVVLPSCNLSRRRRRPTSGGARRGRGGRRRRR